MNATTPFRRSDPDTSREAAEQHATKAESHRQIIAAYVRTFSGHTSAEVAVATRLERHEVSRRLADLEKSGDVRKGPERPCETNGHKMVTWLPAVRRSVDREQQKVLW